MENACHTLVGAALAKAGLDRVSPLAMPTMLVAANFPDVDVVSGLWGDLAYLEHHRGITHSVLGLLVQGPLLAGAAVMLDRLARRRHRGASPPARFLPLLAVALVGLASHVLLDYTNSYGVKPWLPFDASWYYGDIVFVVDPWLWLLLGGALWLGARRTRKAAILWSLFFTLAAGLVVASNAVAPRESGGPVATAVWLGLLAAIVLLRLVSHGVNPVRLATLALVGLVCYWGALAVAHGLATAAASRGTGSRVSAMPTLMRPDRWRILALTPTELRIGEVSLGSRDAVSLTPIPRNLRDPAVEVALQTCPGEVALSFNRFLYAEVDPMPDGSRTVLLRDARFATVPGRYGFATTPVRLDTGLRPVPDERPCPKFGSAW